MPEVKTDVVTLKVSDRTEMRAFLAFPPNVAKSPGLFVFQEAFGVNEHIRDVTARFAEEGFVAIAPELFHRTAAAGFEGSYSDFNSVMPHVSALKDASLEADIRSAHDCLLSQKTIDRNRFASVGFCMGGRVSFLANLVLPLRAAISFYGGGIAPRDGRPGLLERAKETHGPLFLFWGGLDKHITPDQRSAVAESLREARKTFASMEFAGADHAFFCDARPSYNENAAEISWDISLAFLRSNLE